MKGYGTALGLGLVVLAAILLVDRVTSSSSVDDGNGIRDSSVAETSDRAAEEGRIPPPRTDRSRPEATAGKEMLRGLSYHLDGQGEKAIEHARIAVDKAPESAEYRRTLARLLMSEEEYDEAGTHLRQLVQLGEAEAADYRLLALVDLRNQAPEESARSLQKVLELDPDDTSSRSLLWHTRLRLNDPDSVIAEAEQVTRNHGNSHELMMIAGMAMEMKGDTRGALAYYESAVRADPEESERYMERIRSLRERHGGGSSSR